MPVEVLEGSELPVQGVLLGDDADHLLDQRRMRHDIDAADESLTARWDDTGGQDSDRRGLACAVGTQQPEDLA